MIKKIRNKVTEKEAVQWTGDNEAFFWEWLGEQYLRSEYVGDDRVNDTLLCISTLEGVMKAHKGDWIIKGLNGEFYPIKDSIFKKSYEIID